MRLALAAVVGLSLVAIASCGDGDSPDAAETTAGGAAAKRLTAAEQALASRSERAVLRYCGRFALALTGQGNPPSIVEQRRALAATDGLIALARSKPAARVEGGTYMRLLLVDLAEDLEGSNCDQRLVARIDQALATLPR